jgi:hypothetical protein
MNSDTASGGSAHHRAHGGRKSADKNHRHGNGHAAELLAFTIDPKTARIVKLESLDAGGARHELSDEERATLVRRKRERTIEHVIERAFEAGIACVLEGRNAPEDVEESVEDVELTHRLLTPLIECSAAKELLKRDVLDRAILDTLIEHSMTSSPTSGTGSAAESQ